MPPLRSFQKHCWVLVLALALGLVVADSICRMRGIQAVTEMRISDLPIPQKDPGSPTGYALGVRNVILPEMGVDGRHWVMQAQQMLTEGPARVRKVDYDNAPFGREVHWSSSFRWWLAAVAWVDSKISGEPLPISVERVSPYAGTILLVLILLVLVPVVAWRFGAVPASLLTLACTLVLPFFEHFCTGYPDHHGIVGVFGMLTVLFLAAGGAGWLRLENAGAEQFGAEDQALFRWLPDRKIARRWFVASAVAGGAGLWVSAASEVPVMIGVGLGALLSCGLCARGEGSRRAWRYDPALWRLWGAAGFCASLAFYLLEYFPSHFGMRLEVNHPLYALAWLGAGDLLCRACQWFQSGRLLRSPRELPGLLASILAVAVLPACIAFFKERTFFVSDAFLWAIHEDYIMEFRNVFRHLRDPRFNIAPLVNNNVLPLVGMALMLPLLLFTRVRRPWKALVLFTLIPGVTLFLLAILQVRWQGMSCAAWFAAMVMTATVLTRPGTGFRWTLGWKIIPPVLLAFVFLPYPYFAVPYWVKTLGGQSAVSRSGISDAIERDVAYYLRSRLGREKGVVLSGPTVTTSLIYHGGMDGIGTLYWENIGGLKAAAEIFGAPSEEKAFELIQKRGVTHIVVFSFDPFDEEYARLSRGLRLGQEAPKDAFMVGVNQGGRIPSWLRPLPYALPPDDLYEGFDVVILEVAPHQTPELAIVRIAQFLEEKGNPQKAATHLAPLLERQPQFLPALIAFGLLQCAQGQAEEFPRTVEGVRAALGQADALDFEDRVDLARLFAAAADDAAAAEQLRACLEKAREDNLRKLRPNALYDLANLADVLGLRLEFANTVRLAFDLLPPAARGQLLFAMAERAWKGGRHAEALRFYRESLALMPDSLSLLANMAWLLATSPDDSVRNGAEALALAQRARQLDDQQAAVFDVLSCAYALTGDFTNAVFCSQRALALAEKAQQADLANDIRRRLKSFEEGKPYREGAVPPEPEKAPR